MGCMTLYQGSGTREALPDAIQTTMSVCYNIHDTLFHPQEDATVLPALAEKWEKVDDLTWKITLRKDAVFHNGEPVNADAVKFSYDRINSEEVKSPHKGKLSAFTELNVVDDYTFTIKSTTRVITTVLVPTESNVHISSLAFCNCFRHQPGCFICANVICVKA